MDGEKDCTKCGTTKSLTEFRLQKRKSGFFLASWCRMCSNEASKLCMRAKASDPDVIAARRVRDAERYERLKDDPAFREKERARAKEYVARPEVKTVAAERSKDWAAANPKRVQENRKQWREVNPGKTQAYSRASHERRKGTLDYQDRQNNNGQIRRWRVFNQGDGFTAQHVKLCRVFWGNHCAYCGEYTIPGGRAARGSSLDHVIPICRGGEHSPGNIVVCCKTCNFRKNKRMLPDAVLDKLAVQLEAFVAEIPIEASVMIHPSYAELRAIGAAEERLRGRGVPVGTDW